MSNEYEFIIVGTGVAATLIAKCILERKPSASILMLEAGERIASRDRGYWWNLALNNKTPYAWTYDDEEDDPHSESSQSGTGWVFKNSRVRAFGGSTMHWGGWSLRFKEEDFECFSRTGRGADWPISYEDLEPWYTKAELELSVCGDANDEGPKRNSDFPIKSFPWSLHEAELADAFEKNGLNAGHMPIARFHRCMTTGTCKYCPIGSRYTAQDQLEMLETNPSHKGLQILTNSPALRLEADKKIVTGVTYWDPIKCEEKTSNAEVVLICAGAYESPKLLMQSKVEFVWPEGVGNRHDQVGRYLVTHTMLRVRHSKKGNPDRRLQEYDFPTLMSRSWDTPERQREGKVFLFNRRSRPNTDIGELMVSGFKKCKIEHELERETDAGLNAFIEEFGEYNNRITLGKGDGKFKLPKTVVEFNSSPDLAETTGKVREEMAEILRYIKYEDVKENRNLTPRGDHASGTCRMGADPSRSVTNSNLQVHEIDNLYICSNAVFPSASAVNPTLTLAALSLRLGAHLTEKI